MKLIRDKVPERARENGDELETRVMNEDEFKIAVKEKLVEEAREVQQAPNKEELIGELADVLELTITVGRIEGISFEEIEQKRKDKLKKAGGFEKKLMLISKR
jgi:predicted house-cleaning noncanonical NTP pyrophosphatase (MazG superfamily)